MRIFQCFACLVLAALAGNFAQAQTVLTWSNTGSDFTAAGSWVGGVAPANDTTTHIAAFASAIPVFHPQLASNYSVAGLRFDASAGSFVFTGTGSLSLGSSGVVNQSTSGAQLVSIPLLFSTASSTISSVGILSLGNPISNNTANGLTVGGTGMITFSAPVSGTGQLIAAGTVRMFGSNSYSGGTTVHSGTLSLWSTATLPAGGNVLIAGTGASATLDLYNSSAVQSIGSLTFGTGGAASAVNSVVLSSIQPLVLGGNLVYNATTNPGPASIAPLIFDMGGELSLGTASRTFDIGDSTNTQKELTISARITGPAGAGITKTGAGALVLSGPGTFNGGVMLAGGTLLVGASSTPGGAAPLSGPLGTGQLTMSAGTTLGGTTSSDSYYVEWVEPITLHNAVALANDASLGTSQGGGAPLVLAGSVTVPAGSTTIHLGSVEPVSFTGTLTAASPGATLTFDSTAVGGRGRAVLDGTTGANLSNLTASGAGIIVQRSTAVPGTLSLRSTNNGYLGIGASSFTASGNLVSGLVADVLARIADRSIYSGTLGFDTDANSLYGAYNFTQSVDLTGFGAGMSLGSLSSAILSGTITPPATGYVFGNGGGLLAVRSGLAGSQTVKVESLAPFGQNALTLALQGTNTFTGNLAVTNSLAILDSTSALPATALVQLGNYGYVGATEMAGSMASLPNLITRLATTGSYTGSSVLGVDSHVGLADRLLGFSYGDPRYVGGTVDLTSLGPIYLGTATDVVFTGPIIAPNQSGAGRTLSLLAAREGRLVIESPLQSSNVSRLVVGTNHDVLGAGTVRLSGQNSFIGGTTLLSGSLGLGASSMVAGSTLVSGPLGTGTLTVPANASAPRLVNGTEVEIKLHNPISLSATLGIGDSVFNFENEPWSLSLNGIISGTGGLAIYSPTVLTGANTYSGGTTWYSGELSLGHDQALGTGSLTVVSLVGSNHQLNVGNASRSIANPVVFSGPDDARLEFLGGQGGLALNGSVALNVPATFAPLNFPVLVNGAITGAGPLVVDGYNALVLNGANTYTGGTLAEQGGVIFGSQTAIPTFPSVGLQSNYNGYIGLADNTGSLQTGFIDRFNKAQTQGTIGLDTPPALLTRTFSGNIDLTGFDTAARLGSASTAIFTGTLTPQSSVYRFGGGGGLLEVNSGLTNGQTAPRGLDLQSPWLAPLTLRLGGTNTYSGTGSGAATTVYGSALIFKPGAMPASGSFLMWDGGYIGTEDLSSPQTFIGRFEPVGNWGVIGFDATATGVANVTTALDLSAFSDSTIYLGSATSARLSGPITPPAFDPTYRFAGYKGGLIEVSSVLADGAGTRSVVIGDLQTAATMGSPVGYTTPSTVHLTGANTYSGGTLVYAGQLLVGANTALGTGSVTVDGPIYYQPEGFSLPEVPLLAASQAVALANSFTLNSDLTLTGSSALTLSGPISGVGELYKTGTGTVTLSGSNTFTGGVYIAQGNVTFASALAAGTGPLRFGTAQGPSATFTVDTVINGISGEDSSDRIYLSTGRTLTINQTFDATYAGQFVFSGASLIYGGPTALAPTSLRLTGASTYTGTTTINSGVAITAGSSGVFGTATNPVNLSGGRLTVESGVTVANALSLNSGVVEGDGTLQPSATVQIATGVTVSPGSGGVGTLTFADSVPSIGTVLSLAGGQYLWEIADASSSAMGSWDRINVTGAVNIAATAVAPFHFKILPAPSISLLDGIPGFDPYASYSWPVLTATSISGFTGTNQFALDSSHVNSFIAGGSFSFSLNPSTNTLLLNFTPVPEPSTYVMLGVGAAVVLLVNRRRRSGRR